MTLTFAAPPLTPARDDLARYVDRLLRADAARAELTGNRRRAIDALARLAAGAVPRCRRCGQPRFVSRFARHAISTWGEVSGSGPVSFPPLDYAPPPWREAFATLAAFDPIATGEVPLLFFSPRPLDGDPAHRCLNNLRWRPADYLALRPLDDPDHPASLASFRRYALPSLTYNSRVTYSAAVASALGTLGIADPDGAVAIVRRDAAALARALGSSAYSEATIATRLPMLQAYGCHLYAMGLVDLDDLAPLFAARPPRKRRACRGVLAPDRVATLLAALREADVRARAAVALAVGCALRPREILTLTVGDLIPTPEGVQVSLPSSTGASLGARLLPPAFAPALADLLASLPRPLQPRQPLFTRVDGVGRKATHLSRQWLYVVVRDAIAGLRAAEGESLRALSLTGLATLLLAPLRATDPAGLRAEAHDRARDGEPPFAGVSFTQRAALLEAACAVGWTPDRARAFRGAVA